MNNLRIFIDLTRLNKPIGFMLLFWPCSWGLAFANSFTQNSEIFIPFFFSKPSNLNPTIFIKGKKSITYRNFDQFRSMYSDIFNNNQTTLHYTQYKSIYKRYNLIKMLLNDKL